MTYRTLCRILGTLCLALALLACQSAPRPAPGSEVNSKLSRAKLAAGAKLRVTATTTIVADLARQVGGGLVEVSALIPVGTDPHAFEPTPGDAAAIGQAQVILANGAGLEEFLAKLLESAGGSVPVVYLAEGITLRQAPAGGGEGPGNDPHTWTTPPNASIMVRNIATALSALDPDHATAYQANAKDYEAQLAALDTWVREQINTIPQGSRKLVTDHANLGYFAAQYGLEQVGSVIPGISSVAEPSAQEIATLEDAIRRGQIKAVFVDASVSPLLAARVASDTGVTVVRLYNGSLGAPGSGADTYLDFIRYNTRAIVTALR